MIPLARVLAASAVLSGCSVATEHVPCSESLPCSSGQFCGPGGFCLADADAGADTIADAGDGADLPVIYALSAVSAHELAVTVERADTGGRVDSIGACASDRPDSRVDERLCVSEPAGTRLRVDFSLGSQDAGSLVWVYPAVWVGGEAVFGEPRQIRMPPQAPENVAASDGTSPLAVTVRWDASVGAERYGVFRDGVLLAVTTSNVYVDTTAVSGGPPGAPPDVVASEAMSPDFVELRWGAPTVSAGPAHEYAVHAVGRGGISPLSEADSGFRGAEPVVGFRLSRPDSDQVTQVDAQSRRFVDVDTPAGFATLVDATATRGDYPDGVELFAQVETSEGSAVTYEVEALNGAGVGPAARSNHGRRAAPQVEVEWKGMLNDGYWPIGDFDVLAALDWFWEFSTPEATTFVDEVATGSFVYFVARITFDLAASPWRAVEVGWAAECAVDTDCDASSDCRLGLCHPAGYARIRPVYNMVGWTDPTNPYLVGFARPFSARFERSFDVALTEVTQGEWADVFGENPSFFASCGGSCPVENITWYSMLEYTNEVSIREGLEPCFSLVGCTGDAGSGTLNCSSVTVRSASGLPLDCEGYRLPHELEWELAARGAGRVRPGPQFNDAGCLLDYAAVSAQAWLYTNSLRESAECSTTRDAEGRCRAPWPVGMREPNLMGAYDMMGNVNELVWEREWDYASVEKVDNHSVEAPVGGAVLGDVGMRGGSARECLAWVFSGTRRYFAPGRRDPMVGFRVARSVL